MTIRLPEEGTTIGMWNICSVNVWGKVQELTYELKCYWCDILCIGKVRWTGFGETTTDRKHKIWYCREDLTDHYGVAFIAQKEVVSSKDFQERYPCSPWWLECQSTRPWCIPTLGRDRRKIWHWTDKWQMMETFSLRKEPLTHPCQHSPPPQDV